MDREVGLDDDRQVGVVAASSTRLDVSTHPGAHRSGQFVVDVGV